MLGFGAANMIFSSLAYFLVENRNPDTPNSKPLQAAKKIVSNVTFFFVGKEKLKHIRGKGPGPSHDDTATMPSRKDGYVRAHRFTLHAMIDPYPMSC